MREDDGDDNDDEERDVFVKQMSVHRYSHHDIVACEFLNLVVIWIFSDNVHIRNFEWLHERYYDVDLNSIYWRNLDHREDKEIFSDVEWWALEEVNHDHRVNYLMKVWSMMI